MTRKGELPDDLACFLQQQKQRQVSLSLGVKRTKNAASGSKICILFMLMQTFFIDMADQGRSRPILLQPSSNDDQMARNVIVGKSII